MPDDFDHYPEEDSLPALALEQERQLDETGCIVLPQTIDHAWLTELRQVIDDLFQKEGSAAGSEFKQEEGARRLANLINKNAVFQRVISYGPMLSAVRRVLGRQFKLSSVNARSASPHNGLRQPLHCDMGALPDKGGNWVCNAIWMLDDFTLENGPTRFIPGSHRSGRLPQEELGSLTGDLSDQQLVTGKAGSVVVMNAHVWHGGMENRSDEERRAIHAFFARRDKPQQQYQKRLVDASRQSTMPATIRWLLALDDEENDRASSGDIQRSGFLA